MRPCGTTRLEDDSRIVPSAPITPARKSSAIASMIPDPQMPVIPVRRTAREKVGWSDQNSEPTTRIRGSSVSRSIRTRSTAPGAAR